MASARRFLFGPFELLPERQLLLRNDVVVKVGGRSLDLLTALVERPGELLSKADLIASAWPSTTVDEGNLKVNIASLRRALADDPDAHRYIATVTGRGYRFVANVETRHHDCDRDGPIVGTWSAGLVPDGLQASRGARPNDQMLRAEESMTGNESERRRCSQTLCLYTLLSAMMSTNALGVDRAGSGGPGEIVDRT